MTSREQEFLAASDPEKAFMRHIEELLTHRAAAPRGDSGGSGRRSFRPLLMGYNGAGNVGSDVRVAEMLRQFARLFAHVEFDPGLFVIEGTSEARFSSVRLVPRDCYAPDFIAREVPRHDAVIACEGSMFTSTFSDAYASGLIGSIGYARTLGKAGIGYGSDAGKMTAKLIDFVPRVCQDALIIARSKDTQRALDELGLRTRPGVDTAWTFEPAGVDADAILASVGWNGRSPLVAVCPINPFWWPAQIDLEKARALQTEGRYQELHSRSVFFMSWSDERERKFQRYLEALADTIEALRKSGRFPILIAMDRLDVRACESLAQKLHTPIPQFVGATWGMDATVALLQRASLVVSSRFHATLFAIAAGVPVIGVSMDSRIHALFLEHGLARWLIDCSAPDLRERLFPLGETLLRAGDDMQDGYRTILASQIKAFGQMGIDLLDELAACDPGFPPGPLKRSWDACLPALSPRIERALSEYA